MLWTHAVVLWLALLDDPANDLRRFPPRAFAQYSYLISEASFRRQMRELSMTVESDPIDRVVYNSPLLLHSPERAYRIETIQRTRHCRDCWRALTRAGDLGREWRLRRYHLEELRLLLGEEDWAAGQMPPPVPWGRFGRR